MYAAVLFANFSATELNPAHLNVQNTSLRGANAWETRSPTKEGTQIYFQDWGIGQPVVFSHGWPLSADAWDDQMLFLGAHDFRVIAHDRRGHGRSSQPWNGNDLDTYADDLAELGHGTRRVAKAVLIGAIPPLMLRTPNNPGGLPIDVFDRRR